MVSSKENVTEGAMPNKRMSIDHRFKYLDIQYDRYKKAKRQEKSKLLNEMVEITGLNRKTVIRHMRKRPIRRRPKVRHCGVASSVGARMARRCRMRFIWLRKPWTIPVRSV